MNCKRCWNRICHITLWNCNSRTLLSVALAGGVSEAWHFVNSRKLFNNTEHCSFNALTHLTVGDATVSSEVVVHSLSVTHWQSLPHGVLAMMCSMCYVKNNVSRSIVPPLGLYREVRTLLREIQWPGW